MARPVSDKAASLSRSAAPFQSYGPNFTPIRRTPPAPPSPAPLQPPRPGSASNPSADRQFAESPEAAPRTPDILGLGGGQEGVPFPSARVQFSMSPVTQLRRPATVCSVRNMSITAVVVRRRSRRCVRFSAPLPRPQAQPQSRRDRGRDRRQAACGALRAPGLRGREAAGGDRRGGAGAGIE